MFGIENTILGDDGVREGVISPEVVVESDMIMVKKTLVYRGISYKNTKYLVFKAYSTCECLFHYIEFV
jgi:hypothetical protein